MSQGKGVVPAWISELAENCKIKSCLWKDGEMDLKLEKKQKNPKENKTPNHQNLVHIGIFEVYLE